MDTYILGTRLEGVCLRVQLHCSKTRSVWRTHTGCLLNTILNNSAAKTGYLLTNMHCDLERGGARK